MKSFSLLFYNFICEQLRLYYLLRWKYTSIQPVCSQHLLRKNGISMKSPSLYGTASVAFAFSSSLVADCFRRFFLIGQNRRIRERKNIIVTHFLSWMRAMDQRLFSNLVIFPLSLQRELPIQHSVIEQEENDEKLITIRHPSTNMIRCLFRASQFTLPNMWYSGYFHADQ